MKNQLLILLTISALFSACKKEPKLTETTPVEFITTTYGHIGTFDTQGRPQNLTSDAISKPLLDYVKQALPENGDLRTTNPQYLQNADLAITTKSDVYITFVTEGSSYTNTVGYYTYKTGSSPKKPEDIKNIMYIFPHAQMDKGGALKPGDRVKLGSFDSGTSIGFVLLQNGWNVSTQQVNDKAPHFLSNMELNPENRADLKPHTAIFEYASEKKVIIGFEDVNRTLEKCDHDFNDVVMYATVSSI